MIKKLKLETIIIFLYSVLLITLPFPKENAFNIVLIIVAIFNIIYHFKEKNGIKLKNTKYVTYIFLNTLFFIVYILSYFISDDKHSAFVSISKKAYFLAIPILFFIGPRITKLKINKILYYFVINLLLTSVLGLLKSYYLYHNQLFDNYSYDTMLTALGIHLTYYGVLVVFAIYLLLHNVFNSKSKKTKFFSILFLCFFYLFLMFLATRIIIVISLLIAIFMFLKYLKSKTVFLMFFILVSMFGSLLHFSNSPVVLRFKSAFYSGLGNNSDIDSREIHWRSVINSLKTKKSFVIGNGIGDKQIKLNNEYKRNEFHGAIENYNAHNQYLEVLVSTGIIGLIIFLSIFIYMIYISIKNKSEVFFIFQIIFIVVCLTESMFERQLGIITYLTINSLLLHSFTTSEQVLEQ